jgi:hypothetical protein
MIGNKGDLEQHRTIPSGAAQEFANRDHFLEIETSAKTGDGVEEAMEAFVKEPRGRPDC